jgi:hypothetical protein
MVHTATDWFFTFKEQPCTELLFNVFSFAQFGFLDHGFITLKNRLILTSDYYLIVSFRSIGSLSWEVRG